MRLLLSSLMLLCIHFQGFSQDEFDKIKIYFFIEDLTMGLGESIEWYENSVRVNGSIKISILEKNEIEEVSKELLLDSLTRADNALGEFFRTQMVVDFISRNRIIKTVAISSENTVRFDSDIDKVYTLDGNVKRFYNRYLEFFRKINSPIEKN